jgi:hypothetical protein
MSGVCQSIQRAIIVWKQHQTLSFHSDCNENAFCCRITKYVKQKIDKIKKEQALHNFAAEQNRVNEERFVL